MSEPHDWMAGMTDLQRAEVARLESRIVSFEKRWQSLEADWNDCRKLLAAAIKERDEARLQARGVDTRHPFFGGKLDGWMIDTDAAVYIADGEKYYRQRCMCLVTDHSDGTPVSVLLMGTFYRNDESPIHGDTPTEAQQQRMRFVEVRRFMQETQKKKGRKQ